MIVFDETGREIPWPELEAFLKARRDSRPGAAGATARKDEE
jgi:hypothetical protein